MYGESEFAVRLLIACPVHQMHQENNCDRVSDWVKDIHFRKRQVRIKEHSRPRVSCSNVHIIPELVEPIDITYPHLISNNIADEGNKQKIEWYLKKYD